MRHIKTTLILIAIFSISWLMGSFAVNFECLPNIIIDTLLKIGGGGAILILIGLLIIGGYSIVYEYFETQDRYKQNRRKNI